MLLLLLPSTVLPSRIKSQFYKAARSLACRASASSTSESQSLALRQRGAQQRKPTIPQRQYHSTKTCAVCGCAAAGVVLLALTG